MNLYRRHRPDCEGERKWNSRSGEFDERKKGWGRRCDCQIHASGTLGGKFSRKCLDTSDWTEARLRAAVYEAANSWTSPPPPPASTPEPAAGAESDEKVTITDACTMFVTNRESAAVKGSTLRKYKTFAKQITAYAGTRGYRFIDQFTTTDIDRFWANWKLGPRTKGKRLNTLRAFFRFATNRKWITESPVSADLKPPIGASRVANKHPFTDDDITRIIAATDTAAEYAKRFTTQARYGYWTGEDARTFIWLMLYTGFRISDTALFDMSRLHGDQMFIRAQKNGGDVFAYIPDWLEERLRALAAHRGQRPFIPGTSDKLETVTELWRLRLEKVFKFAGPFDHPATSHRFRHTFARILLQRGVVPADVAELLGDDEKTVREHYARWVPERQARLTKILKDAFRGQAKAKKFAVVAGGRQ